MFDGGASSTSGVTYELYNSTDGVNWTAAYSGANISSNVTVTANGTYSFRVKAVKAGYVDSAYTTSSTSCAVTFTCGAPTSLAVPADQHHREHFLVCSMGEQQHKRRYL